MRVSCHWIRSVPTSERIAGSLRRAACQAPRDAWAANWSGGFRIDHAAEHVGIAPLVESRNYSFARQPQAGPGADLLALHNDEESLDMFRDVPPT